MYITDPNFSISSNKLGFPIKACYETMAINFSPKSALRKDLHTGVSDPKARLLYRLPTPIKTITAVKSRKQSIFNHLNLLQTMHLSLWNDEYRTCLIDIASPSWIIKLEPRRILIRNVSAKRDVLFRINYWSCFACDWCRRGELVSQRLRRRHRHLVFVLPSPLFDDR